MENTFIAPNNQKLVDLIKSLNALTQIEIHTREVLMISAENGTGDLVRQILEKSGLEFHVLNGEQQPAPAPVVVEEKKSTEKVCEFCGNPVSSSRSTICGSAECLRKRQARWNAAYNAKKAEGKTTPEVPFVRAASEAGPLAA